MTDSTTSADSVGRDEYEAVPASKKFIALFVGSQFGLWLAIITPANFTLALRLSEIAPAHKQQYLSVILGIGVLFALFGSPFFGRLSDRMPTRFGRRRPWILGGLVVVFGGLTIVSAGTTWPVLLVGWCVSQCGSAAAYAAITATLPEKVPAQQRGLVSGLLGLTLPVSSLIGTYLIQLFPTNAVLMLLLPAAVGLLAVGTYVVICRDAPAPHTTREPYTLRTFFLSFWFNPRKAPDFAWTFLSRFLLQLGYQTAITYKVYFLSGQLHIPEPRVPHLIFVSTLAVTIASVIAAVLGGKWSDKIQRRRPFVLGSGVTITAGLVGIAFTTNFPMFLVMVTIVGLGYGLFTPIDLALATQVLPNRKDFAKDIGVYNIGATLPQSLVPFFAPFLLATAPGGNYPLIYLVGGALALVGAVTVYRVRSTR